MVFAGFLESRYKILMAFNLQISLRIFTPLDIYYYANLGPKGSLLANDALLFPYNGKGIPLSKLFRLWRNYEQHHLLSILARDRAKTNKYPVK
jgi:hypothetical protein